MHRTLDQYRRQVLLRMVAGAAGLFLLAWGVIPLYTSRFHIGCLVLMLAGLLLLGAALLYPALARGIRRLWKRRAGRITLSGIGAAACLLTLLFLTVSGVMSAAACAPPPEGATVVVLGAALRGEQPSRMLAERLKTAATYLRDHPESSCVVSGGQNDDEIISEAEAMKRYLVGLGIEESRIYLEDRSTNTEENLRMSRDVVEREGLPDAVVVATQEFHQLRARIHAEEAGFEEIGALAARTPWYLFGGYWIRDFAGVCRYLVLGY